MNHSTDRSVGGTLPTGKWEHTVLHSQTAIYLLQPQLALTANPLRVSP